MTDGAAYLNAATMLTFETDSEQATGRARDCAIKPSVLIVEDDDAVRSAWARTLAARAYDVIAVANAESAMPLISPDLCVVLCDVHLPGRDGLWLIEQIRTRFPATAVILATGDHDVPAVTRLEPAVVEYLVKPFPLIELTAAVETGVRWAEFRRAAVL